MAYTPSFWTFGPIALSCISDDLSSEILEGMASPSALGQHRPTSESFFCAPRIDSLILNHCQKNVCQPITDSSLLRSVDGARGHHPTSALACVTCRFVSPVSDSKSTMYQCRPADCATDPQFRPAIRFLPHPQHCASRTMQGRPSFLFLFEISFYCEKSWRTMN
jgi:hypothetical protein